jgi:hypothetical protein
MLGLVPCVYEQAMQIMDRRRETYGHVIAAAQLAFFVCHKTLSSPHVDVSAVPDATVASRAPAPVTNQTPD